VIKISSVFIEIDLKLLQIEFETLVRLC
jgi:hypothetical protein